MKSAAVAALVLLCATGADAGQRHHTTGGTTTLPPSPPVSPFAAGPNTYAPHYDRPSAPNTRGAVYGVPIYNNGLAYVPTAAAPAPAAAPPSPAPDQNTPPAPPKAAEPRPEPPRVAAIHPDVFYVIPGCYAGNRPPIPERLPKGCDPSKLRTSAVR